MARRLRFEFEGAIYHIVNRGNYRSDVFVSAGAAESFLAVLRQTCERHGWRLHAYVVMRNHFHAAVTTPHANLSQGMHWLEGTFAARFNRFRAEHGHLFEGRYFARLVENHCALQRVVDYIHWNPVKAGIVEPKQVAQFRWSSVRQLIAGKYWDCVSMKEWLDVLGMSNDQSGAAGYVKWLTELVTNPAKLLELENDVGSAWAVGTEGWRQSVAREYAFRAATPGIVGEELAALRSSWWKKEFEAALREAGYQTEEGLCDSLGLDEKVSLASQLRRRGVPYSAITRMLGLKSVGALRTRMWRQRNVTR